MDEAVIRVTKVSRSFSLPKGESVEAVKSVSFEAKKGRIFAILGPNGSGKTTLLRMLVGLLRPDAGEIEVSGCRIPERLDAMKKRIGFLTGSAAMHKKLSVRETLELFGDLHGMRRTHFEQRVNLLVDRLDLGDFIDSLVGSLSMGQKQRAMIARTLIHDPEVVIFDEATAGLDVLASRALIEMIRECRDQGKTVIFSTHIMGEVSRLADDVLILHKGQTLFLGEYPNLIKDREAESLEELFVKMLEEAEK